MEIKQLNARFNTDKGKEVKGIEVPVGEGFFVRIARKGNSEAVRLFRELSSTPDIEMARRAGAVDEDTMKALVSEVWSRCIVVGWRGLTENGVEVPYTSEKAKEFLAVKDFFDFVDTIAGAQENYRTEAVNGAADVLGKG